MSKYKPQKDQADILDKAYDLIQSVPYCVFRRKSPLDSDSFRHLIPI